MGGDLGELGHATRLVALEKYSIRLTIHAPLEPAAELSLMALPQSETYMVLARASCFRLLVQLDCCAFAFALANAGKSIAARMAMMAMTTSNSIRVKACDRHREVQGVFIIF